MSDLFTDVQLWVSHLDLPLKQVQNLEKTLSEDEKERAGRFRFAEHRRRFIAARGGLRKILGHYLHLAPQDVAFEYNDRGKPSLPSSFNSRQFHFNVSHSHELALYGFTQSRKIGVDLEYLRPIKDIDQLAGRFFCPSEARMLEGLSSGEKGKAFFQVWTAKEAYLKAIGEGLAGGLDRFEVSLVSGQVQVAGEGQAIGQWHLRSFSPNPDYVATIAVEAADRALSFQVFEFDFSERSLHLRARGVKI